MKQVWIALMVGISTLCGCGKSEPVNMPAAPTKIEVGESYVSVIDKLGKPNINSVSQSSRVLIYDKLEIKLEQDVVTAVFDHR